MSRRNREQRMMVLGVQIQSVNSHNLRANNWYRYGRPIRRSRHHIGIVKVTEREDSSSSDGFQIDKDKAREALKQLDQDIESLSDKRPPRTIIKTPLDTIKSSFNGDSPNNPMMYEEPLELSDSFLTTAAFFLLGFTIFYNILFIKVIKPSIDGAEPVPASLEENRVPISDDKIMQFPLSSVPGNIFTQ